MVQLTCDVAKLHGVKVEGIVCSADNLPFGSERFDIVYAANVLHHVDMDKTINEVKRVLKRGGTFICWDPIKYNPIINIYRKLATDVRTEDEHPVDRNYLRKIRKHFKNVHSRGFWLLTCLIFVKYYFVDKVNPNKERYWKKIVDDADELESFYRPLERIDNLLLKMFPILKWWCWNMVIIADNKEDSNV